MDIEAVCRHEAGHALIAHLLGGEVVCVTVEHDDGFWEGRTEVRWSAGIERAELDRRLAMVAVAGVLAELVHEGDALLEDPDAMSAWRGDEERFLLQTARLESDSRRLASLRRELVSVVHCMLSAEDAVERRLRLVDMLLAHETLDAVLVAEALS